MGDPTKRVQGIKTVYCNLGGVGLEPELGVTGLSSMTTGQWEPETRLTIVACVGNVFK